MAKIAIELERALTERAVAGHSGRAIPSIVARGPGWTVADVICTSGPGDRVFEELHAKVSIAIVAAGSFRYRSPIGRALMTPGAMMLGNAGHCYECGHEHAAGDRCVSFWYSPEYFERIIGAAPGRLPFDVARLPPLRETAHLVADACAGLVRGQAPWEELGVRLAAAAFELASGRSRELTLPPNAEARITDALRTIERELDDADLTLERLAGEARLSPYHFLRTFERITGATPHQFILRARLRRAALRIAAGDDRILDVALDCGFGDVSNFNRAFRKEFGTSPTGYRSDAKAG